MKLEIFVLGGQRIDQKRKKGGGEVRGNEEKGEERRLRKVAGRGEIQRKETKGN